MCCELSSDRLALDAAKALMPCALTWTKSKVCCSACFKQSRMVCFNQQERVVGLMSEVCLFLKEMKSRDRDLLRSLIQSSAGTGHKVLSSLNCLSTLVVRAGIVTGDTLWEPSLAS